MSRVRALLVTLLAAPCACSREAPPAPWFEELGRAAGLDFVHDSGHAAGRYLMPESLCGGAALLDADGDGRLDLYLVQSGSLALGPSERGRNRLYLNRTQHPGALRFEDASAGSGADDPGYGMGVACADHDNDGDVDLYVTNVGPNVLLRNEGAARFQEVGRAAGVAHPGFGASAAFFDYDGDGWLDLYVANYLEWRPESELACKNELGEPDYCSPRNYASPALDALYKNLGDGRFEDVSEASGIASAAATGLGVVCLDQDGDGRLDVFVANDGMADMLWRNQGDGRFVDVASRVGCAIDHSGVEKAGMGVAVADLDGDGRTDLLVGNLAQQSDSLFLNLGTRFEDRSLRAGLALASRPFTRFGQGFHDFDCDGELDLYQANGRVMRQALAFGSDPYAEPNLLLRGRHGPRFEEVLPRGGTRAPLLAASRAAAFGDLDDDGAIDVLVANRDGRAHLLRNVAPRAGRWIGFHLVPAPGSNALHARLWCTVGERRILRELRTSSSYLASNDPRLHIGLGSASEVRQVEVHWPSGRVDRYPSLPAGRYHSLRESELGPR